jgi:hypothetical protein
MKDVPSLGGSKETEDSEFSKRILLYVIATSSRKMIRRLKSEISIPYIFSLERATSVSFDSSQDFNASEEETKNDHLLLKFLFLAIRKDWFPFPTPKLMEQATLAEKGDPFKLYSEDTHVEFHKLLCHLLNQFRVFLDLLSAKDDVPTEGSERFKEKLVSVMLYGYALQKMARGSALPMLLKNITPLLEDHLQADVQTIMSGPKMGMEEGGIKTEHRELGYECDEELEAVQPSVVREKGLPMPLWKSYIDWLRLMVVQFDAVDILVKYVTGLEFPYRSISIQRLVSPPVDNTLLPWQELFTNPELFPTKNEQGNYSTKSNDEILEFLQNASKNPNQSLKWAKAAKKLWVHRNFDVENTKFQINQLKKSSALPGFKKCAEKLYDMLDCYHKSQSDSESPGTVTLISDITHLIQSLCDNADMFVKMNKMNDTPNFTGTLHCEACLASLLNRSVNDDSKYEDILVQLKVGYAVSSCFCYQILIPCDRTLDELWEFQNVVAQSVDISCLF